MTPLHRGIRNGCLIEGIAAVVFGLALFLAVLFAPAIVLELHRMGVL